MWNTKIKVWTPECVNDKEDNIFYFQLAQEDIDSDIYLNFVDRKGDEISQGTLLVFDIDLRVFILDKNLNDNIPIKTDVLGKPFVFSVRELQDYSLANDRLKESHHSCWESDKEKASIKDNIEFKVSILQKIKDVMEKATPEEKKDKNFMIKKIFESFI